MYYYVSNLVAPPPAWTVIYLISVTQHNVPVSAYQIQIVVNIMPPASYSPDMNKITSYAKTAYSIYHIKKLSRINLDPINIFTVKCIQGADAYYADKVFKMMSPKDPDFVALVVARSEVSCVK